MPAKPLYIVTSIKQKRRPASPNSYTGRHASEPMWQVNMKSGFFSGVGVTFSYPDKPKAEAFSEWEIYDPSAIIREAAPGKEAFVVQDIYKTKGYGAKNLYTDKRKVLDNWTVSLESPEGNWIDLWFPTSGEANQYGFGRPYTTLDLFGTVRAPLFEFGSQLEAAVASARDAARQADAAAKAAAAAAYNAERAAYYSDRSGQGASAEAETLAAIQAAAAAAQASATGAGASAAQASNVANAVIQQSVDTLYLAQPDAQRIYFWVTNGGAGGWYVVGTAQQVAAQQGVTLPAAWGPNTYFQYLSAAALQAAGYQHYAAGTFSQPANGLLIGDYESDVSVAAGHIVPH